MFYTASEGFIHGALTTSQDIRILACKTFGASVDITHNTGILVGTSSAHHIASWTILLASRGFSKDLYGLDMPQCPTCIDVSGTRVNCRPASKFSPYRQYVHCSICQSRTVWYTAPPPPVWVQERGLFAWRWPLTEQSIEWVKIQEHQELPRKQLQF